MLEHRMTVFYQHLGKLFYAIAAADKTVRQEEIDTLNEIVRSDWLNLEHTYDLFGSDSAYQIEIVFNWLVENTWDVSQVLLDFKLYKKDHESHFTPQNNKLILKTATKIADSFSGTNKSEQTFLNELRKILTN